MKTFFSFFFFLNEFVLIFSVVLIFRRLVFYPVLPSRHLEILYFLIFYGFTSVSGWTPLPLFDFFLNSFPFFGSRYFCFITFDQAWFIFLVFPTKKLFIYFAEHYITSLTRLQNKGFNVKSLPEMFVLLFRTCIVISTVN